MLWGQNCRPEQNDMKMPRALFHEFFKWGGGNTTKAELIWGRGQRRGRKARARHYFKEILIWIRWADRLRTDL